MTSLSNKTTLLIFASHHLLGNVASQRFIALTKYLPEERYNIHVFSKTKEGLENHIDKKSNITIHGLPGECVGSGASRFESLFVFISAKFWRLPFFTAPENTWLSQSMASAEKVLSNENIEIKNTLIIATYSPIDTLVAAQCLAKKYQLPCILDFRDGFVFEGLGRKGKLAEKFRAWIEKNVIQGATLITTVSTPLVDFFQNTYQTPEVKLLPNGFDPAEFSGRYSDSDIIAANNILPEDAKGKFIIGHIGRIGASDGSSTEALESLIKTINNLSETDKLHFLFVGILTPTEELILDKLRCTKTLSKPVKRSVAQLIMRNSDALLLVTGNRSSCVTGKIFEYMASETPIICCSRVENEAMKILEETGCGEGFITGDEELAKNIFSALISGLRGEKNNPQSISKYSRKEQSKILAHWIQANIETKKGVEK